MVHGQELQEVVGKVTRAAGSLGLAPVSATDSLQHPWPIHFALASTKTALLTPRLLRKPPAHSQGWIPVPSNPCGHWETGSWNQPAAWGGRDGWRQSNLKAFFLSLGKKRAPPSPASLAFLTCPSRKGFYSNGLVTNAFIWLQGSSLSGWWHQQ